MDKYDAGHQRDGLRNGRAIVVIPCLNEALHLQRTVEAVLAGLSDRFSRIVIVDGGSTDGTIEIAKNLVTSDKRVVLLHNPKRLQSAGINLAVGEYSADSTYLVRIDAHGDYPPGYADALVDEAELMGSDSVVVSMETKGYSGVQKAAADAQNSILGNGGSAHRSVGPSGRWVIHGHHALMRVDAFMKVGGYDETFSHNEDAELDYRLTSSGHKIWLTGKTRMTYYPRASFKSLGAQYQNYGRGRAKTMLKHRMRPQVRQLAMIGVAPTFILAIAAPLLPILAAPLAFWAFVCVTYGAYRTLKLGSHYLTGVTAMVMHSAWSFGFWRGLYDGLTKPSAPLQR